jgi:hypothetical protein
MSNEYTSNFWKMYDWVKSLRPDLSHKEITEIENKNLDANNSYK